MTVGVLREPSHETRVSLLPEAVAALSKKSIVVLVENGAGEECFADDDSYRKAGGEIRTRDEVIQLSDAILSINDPEPFIGLGAQPKILIGVFFPLYQPESMRRWAERRVTIFSLDMLPRTSRAQLMDVLSSQANIAGYKAILEAANLYSRYFPMFMTAAGTIAPAKVLILGAGVAGLQAIATARRLGAVVEVFDTRPAVREEVASLGAKFVLVEGAADATHAGGYAVEQTEDYNRRQQERITESVARADIIVTTAQIFGKRAPILITEDMLKLMRPGSIIIDIAAGTGGNTPFTKNNETVNHNGVLIVGNSNLPARMPSDASKLYGKNMLNFLQLIIRDGQLNLNWDDDLVKGSCITHNGEIVNERVRTLL